MDRRRTLAAVGAISLTASAAVVALASSMGLFGLADTSPRVGKLSPIDATQPARTETHTVYVDDPVPTAGSVETGAGTDSGSVSKSGTGANATGGHQGVDDPPSATQPAANTSPAATDQHAAADSSNHDVTEHEGDVSSSPGSPSSGSDHNDD